MLKGIFLTQNEIDRYNDIFLNPSHRLLYKQAKALEVTVMNVGAILSKDWSKDDIFYGFNKDLNDPVETFNINLIEKIQTKVEVPDWIQDYIDNYQSYATPFLVIESKEERS